MITHVPMPHHDSLFAAFELCAAWGLTPAQFRRAAKILGLDWKAAFSLDERDDLLDAVLILGLGR